MKAVAVYPGERQVKLIERPAPPAVRSDEVLLRILDVGICGTDWEICTFEYGTPPAGEDHLVIGHEALAQVVEVGSAVERLHPGDLVVPTVRRPCPDPGCRACRSGHQDFCYTGDFTERGIKGAHGYLTEYVVDFERNMMQVPADLGDLAILTEPLTIAEKARAQISAMMQERPPWLGPDGRGAGTVSDLSALVLGMGPVGVLGAMTLAAAGFRTYVYSREMAPDPRIDLVESVGARYRSSQAMSFVELAEEIGNIDVIYEAVGHSHFALDALRVLGKNGIYILTGVPGLQDLVQADPARMMRDMVLKNQVLLGTVNAGPEAFAAAIQDLRRFTDRWPDTVRALIAGRYPPEHATELIFGRPPGIKSVVSFRDSL
jgi:glucose 1-dehydrogenase